MTKSQVRSNKTPHMFTANIITVIPFYIYINPGIREYTHPSNYDTSNIERQICFLIRSFSVNGISKDALTLALRCFKFFAWTYRKLLPTPPLVLNVTLSFSISSVFTCYYHPIWLPSGYRSWQANKRINAF